ncbi:flagellar assembly protein FliW [Roseburia sp. AF22-2LB]|jgi:flagellar assembly factor FliW|uniref:flagellar assembly protein FliW n=1 Tax=unclassified Roseburia TaxID=2637578 RepID=UPI000E50F533|nr:MULTISPECIES: flagellar assembly protein FliW [unclassified Roseburia]RGG42085.1 flagellar assembly protein FliW [Roseburia sp. AF22-8AC]RGG44476.1 flagellar assembly protein FliW [Roseburia sp. AF22-2LB]
MKAATRLFGEIEIDESKIITFEDGIIGFPDMKKFTLIFDEEKEDRPSISWLQSMDEPEIAFPVMDPLFVCETYNPSVEDELLKNLGTIKEDNLYVLVTVTVPQNIKELAVNLKAPIVINTDTRKASQIIVEDDLPVRYRIYEILEEAKKKAGE